MRISGRAEHPPSRGDESSDVRLSGCHLQSRPSPSCHRLLALHRGGKWQQPLWRFASREHAVRYINAKKLFDRAPMLGFEPSQPSGLTLLRFCKPGINTFINQYSRFAAPRSRFRKVRIRITRQAVETAFAVHPIIKIAPSRPCRSYLDAEARIARPLLRSMWRAAGRFNAPMDLSVKAIPDLPAVTC
jgi:hypothetical protein